MDDEKIPQKAVGYPFMEIPTTLQKLLKRSADPNPVNIAGYGRESTHKGYLSWILSTYRNKLAVELIRALSHELPKKANWGTLEYADCEYEQCIGAHRADLQIKLCKDEFSPHSRLLPIELKTDSGPSGEGQFSDMTAYVDSHTEYLGCWVICLGSSSVQNHSWGEFHMITPEKILISWEPYYHTGPKYLRDWMDMVALEVARQRLAAEIYREYTIDHDHNCVWKYGLRNEKKHLYYYLYAQLRKYLSRDRSERSWAIYDGGHNAVMNLAKGPESWRPVVSIPGLEWFFEFNDDQFYLKLHNKSDNSDSVKQWVSHSVQLLGAVDAKDRILPMRRLNWKSEYPSLGYWKLDLSDFKTTSEQIDGIIGAYGAKGVMGSK